jgi:hypothetical protein
MLQRSNLKDKTSLKNSFQCEEAVKETRLNQGLDRSPFNYFILFCIKASISTLDQAQKCL